MTDTIGADERRKAPTRVYLLRHAESANNSTKRSSNRDKAPRAPDPPLSQVGEQQARAAADFFSKLEKETCPEHHVTEIWSSLMLRCIQTTAPICEALPHARLIGESRLHEEGGCFCGERRGPPEPA